VGIFFAGFFVELLPFKLLRMWRLTPSEASYWVVAASILTAIVSLSCFLAITVYRHLKARHINVDLLVLLGGSVLAIWYASRALPAGW
jgi:cation transport ATPase